MNFEVNSVPYNDEFIERIENLPILHGNQDRFQVQLDFYDGIRKKFPQFKSPTTKCVKVFKKVFGEQQVTRVYRHRNWIWTFSAIPSSDQGAIIYCCIDRRGVAWHYDKRTKQSDVLVLWKAIIERIMEWKSDS